MNPVPLSGSKMAPNFTIYFCEYAAVKEVSCIAKKALDFTVLFVNLVLVSSVKDSTRVHNSFS
jgi:hypothetical protein